MICVNCRKNRMEKRSAAVPAELRGETFLVQMDEALVCPDCAYTTIDGRKMPEYMRLTADAYRHKHGLLTSDEIRAARSRLRMSQEQFAAYLGVGVASVKRWELGQVQDVALDRLIRITTNEDEARENYRKVAVLSAPVEPTLFGQPLLSYVLEAQSFASEDWRGQEDKYEIDIPAWEEELVAA